MNKFREKIKTIIGCILIIIFYIGFIWTYIVSITTMVENNKNYIIIAIMVITSCVGYTTINKWIVKVFGKRKIRKRGKEVSNE